MPESLARNPLPGSIQQIAGLYVQGNGQLVDNGDGGVTSAPLEVADVGAVDAGAECQFLLRPAFLLALAAKILGKALNDIHLSMVAAL